MKTLKIIKKEIDRNGGLTTLSFKLEPGDSLSNFDCEQIGGACLGTGSEPTGPASLPLSQRPSIAFYSTAETTLEAGDSITDDFGGDPVIAEGHGKAEDIKITNAFGTLVDYRDAFWEKQHG